MSTIATALSNASPQRTPDVIVWLEARIGGDWHALAERECTFNQATKAALKLRKQGVALIRARIHAADDLRIVEKRRPRVKI